MLKSHAGCFHATVVEVSGWDDILWPKKPELFTVWALIEKVSRALERIGYSDI